MKNYTMQALVMTKDGARDRFYCKDCAIKIRGELLIEPLEWHKVEYTLLLKDSF